MTVGPSVLFVCTGNQCRSPMAQEILRARLKKKLGAAASKNWRVDSAGTWAQAGLPATQGAQAVMTRRGLSLAGHRSQPVTEDLLDSYNLVLVMESGHKEALRAEFPQFAPKIFMLSEMVYSNFDVKDPLGGKPEDYETTADLIEGAIEDSLTRIIHLASTA